jgi:ectoine hydroxylase-related dioxygenase (phytanoyl-CoA dioxygenase family)
LRRVIHGTRITELMSDLLGTPAAHFSFAWLRAMAAGRASPLHVDHPYMNRGSNRLLTVWTPLGDVGLDEGPLYLLEGSHRWPDLRAQFQGRDVDRDDHPPGHITDHPLDLASRHGARLLTTEFAPGDVLVFGMFTAHAAFDNTSATGRVRISCDTRFQPAADPMDDRWSGDNPPAHGGLGYGCLAASRPLTADLPRR